VGAIFLDQTATYTLIRSQGTEELKLQRMKKRDLKEKAVNCNSSTALELQKQK
jgi:hypothetical protein